MSDDLHSFGARLRRLRVAAALSQEELAERAGLSARGISDLERGARRAPYLTTVRLLADALGLDADERAALVHAARGKSAASPASIASVAAVPFPMPLTPLIGRERQLGEVTALLGCGNGRLVTITGAGGTGKTRLALEAGAQLGGEFGDGVVFVDLAPLREAELVQVGAGAGVEVECVIDSTVVGVAKPDARIFHIALDTMGVEPGDAWYVGDTPSFDVTGARNAGLRPLLFDPFHYHEGAAYDRVGSLREVAQQIGNEVGPAQER